MDINEASLAVMGQESGRWPWPRQARGGFLEHLDQLPLNLRSHPLAPAHAAPSSELSKPQ